MTKIRAYSADEIATLREYAWLNLDNILELADVHSPTFGGFYNQKIREYPSNLMAVLRNPDYFYFTCKYLLNIEILPFQQVILKELWQRPFPMLVAARGGSKTFLFALYAVLRSLLCPNSKVVICGAGFRQSKLVFEYAENIWHNSPVLRDICDAENNGPKHDTDRWSLKIGSSIIMALPIGNGEKIRGIRATHIICDEFAIIPVEIYDTVISGFAAVSAAPSVNVKERASKKLLTDLGVKMPMEQKLEEGLLGNQSIIGGTGDYAFKHFGEYWRRYKRIIESRGDEKVIAEIFDGIPPEGFDHRDFSVIRLPYELLPAGFMDEKHMARAKAVNHSTVYMLEYGAIFAQDSTGYFRRSLIEGCVAHAKNKIRLPSCGEEYVEFSPLIRGNPGRQYFIGVDVASERDNFAIVILEAHSDHRRIVYCWTVNKKIHRQKLKEGETTETDFYSYAARKLRELMKLFPCTRVGIDVMGGGIALIETLHDNDKLKTGELPIWPTIDPDKEKDSDNQPGLHIIEEIMFANSEWVMNSNHGMRLDMESKILLFPFFDSISLELASEEDSRAGRKYDTLEDVTMEIEELKNELTSIVHTQTGISARDRFDVPEIKLSGSKKGRQRKDRYTALLIANGILREIVNAIPEVKTDFGVAGGFVRNMREDENQSGPDCVGPLWYKNMYKD